MESMRQTSTSEHIVFYTGRDDLEKALGPLEARILILLWDATGPRTIREICETIGDLAMSTIQTTVNRMLRKGMIAQLGVRHRGPASNARYIPAQSEQELRRRIVREVIQALRDFIDPDGLADVLEEGSAHVVKSH